MNPSAECYLGYTRLIEEVKEETNQLIESRACAFLELFVGEVEKKIRALDGGGLNLNDFDEKSQSTIDLAGGSTSEDDDDEDEEEEQMEENEQMMFYSDVDDDQQKNVSSTNDQNIPGTSTRSTNAHLVPGKAANSNSNDNIEDFRDISDDSQAVDGDDEVFTSEEEADIQLLDASVKPKTTSEQIQAGSSKPGPSKRKLADASDLQCPFDACQGGFPLQSQLNDHLASSHGIDQFRCKLQGCDQVFGTMNDLSKHLRDHMPPKPSSAASMDSPSNVPDVRP